MMGSIIVAYTTIPLMKPQVPYCKTSKVLVTIMVNPMPKPMLKSPSIKEINPEYVTRILNFVSIPSKSFHIYL